MTSRSQIWDGLVWVDLTSGVDTATLDATYLRLDGGNTPMTGALVILNRLDIGDPDNTSSLPLRVNREVNALVSETLLGSTTATGLVGSTILRNTYDSVVTELYLGAGSVLLEDGNINTDTPAIGFRSNPTTGLYHESAFNDIRFMINGNTEAVLNDVTFQLFPGINFSMEPDTTASTPDVVWRTVIGDVLEIVRNTSSARYKQNIAPDPTLADLVLNPVRFYHEGDDDNYIGFIAEDIEAQDVDAVTYMDDENGDPRVENYDLRAIVAILAAKVNRLEGA